MEDEKVCENVTMYLEKELLAPYNHILQVSGKRMRWKLVRAFNYWLKLPEDKLAQIIDSVDMVHISSLLMDDIQDNTNVRRGLLAAHRVYGLPLTINASMHVALLALSRVRELGPKAIDIFCNDLLGGIRGQGIDIYWRENLLCPTEEEYKYMAKQKTGQMFGLPVRLCQLFSEYKTDLSQLAMHFGLYFQIRDDYCNLKQQEALEEWPRADDLQERKVNTFCEDLTEGKFSFPIIHAMNTPYRDQILNILRQRTEDISLKRYCVSLLELSGSLQYTHDVLLDLERNARDEVARFGGNPDMEAVLNEMQSWKLQ